MRLVYLIDLKWYYLIFLIVILDWPWYCVKFTRRDSFLVQFLATTKIVIIIYLYCFFKLYFWRRFLQCLKWLALLFNLIWFVLMIITNLRLIRHWIVLWILIMANPFEFKQIRLTQRRFNWTSLTRTYFSCF